MAAKHGRRRASSDGTHLYDMARLLLAHNGQHCLGHGNTTEKVSFQLIANLVQLHVLAETSAAESGVVHQHVDAAMIADDRVHRSTQRVEFRDVEPTQVEAIEHASLSRCVLKAAAAFEVAHGRHHAIAVERQLDGGQQSNAASASGYKGDFFISHGLATKSFRSPHRAQTRPFTHLQLQCWRRYEKITGLYILS